ncbi:MAG: serine/threonine-protein kinase [Polyangiaceae bacterium]
MSASARTLGVVRPARKHLEPGRVIADRYVIERVVNENDLTIVLEAVRRDLDQPVTLKVLSRSLAAHEPIVACFLREAKRAGSLRSAHALRVLDVGRCATGEPFFATERLGGVYLHTTLASSEDRPTAGRRYSVARAAELIAEACDAVAEMHARGWVHGDLKPRNLFLEARSRGGSILKVCESDRVALLAEIERVDASLTPGRLLQGEPLYLAPEQLDPRTPPDARADVWSLGAIFFELLTGRTPFEGDGLTQRIQRVSEAKPRAPSELASGISPAIDDVVLGCLRRDPADRYPDARAVLAAVEEAIGDRGDTALMEPSAFDRESETEVRPLARDRDTPTSVLAAETRIPAGDASFRALPSVAVAEDTSSLPKANETSLPSLVTSTDPSARALNIRPHPLGELVGGEPSARTPRANLPRVLLLVLGVLTVAALITWVLHRLA